MLPLTYCTVKLTVAVRVTDPAVAVIPTFEVPAGVGEVLEHPTTTPSPTTVSTHRKNMRNRLALPNERLRRNTVIDANGSRKAKTIPDKWPLGFSRKAVFLVVRIVALYKLGVVPVELTCTGAIEQVAPAGKPVQSSFTLPVKPKIGCRLSITCADEPLATVSELVEVVSANVAVPELVSFEMAPKRP